MLGIDISWQAQVAAVVVVAFYVCMSAALQLLYYTRRVGHEPQWKTQPDKLAYRDAAHRSWWPALDLLVPGRAVKAGRHPLHSVFATVNLCIAAAFMAGSVEMTVRGYSKLLWTWDDVTPAYFVLSTLLAMAWENVLEYYYHLLMHTRLFYGLVHKYHHYYKSPEPFDDLMVFPVEVFFFYIILYSPPFVIPMHYMSLLIYAGFMGITGMTDHCGIRMRFLGIYDTQDHDLHHSKTNVNFGFPFIFMDLLHGTYRDPHAKASAK